MRINFHPVFFYNAIYAVRLLRVAGVLKPFEGQLRKLEGVFRWPERVFEMSGIKVAGMGFKN